MADPRLQPVISNESGAKSINQLVYRDQGRSEYSAPITHTGYNSSSYARTVKNIGSGGNVEHWLTSTGNLLLTANDTGLSVGVGLTLPFMTTGSIPYIGASGLVSQDNANLFWDGPNKRLGIGTAAAPTATLSVGSAGVIRFTVDGATGNLVINTNKFTVAGASGDLAINASKFTVAGATGNLAVNTNKFVIDGATGATIAANTIATVLGSLTGGNVANWTGTATWNNAATSFIANLLDITDTNSAADSVLALWRVGVVPKFQVDKAGIITATGVPIFKTVPVWRQPLQAVCSADLTLTAANQDLAGATVTLDKIGQWVLHAEFDASLIGALDANQTILGQLVLTGGTSSLANSTFATFSAAPTSRATVGATWFVSVTATSVVAKIQARKTGGTGTSVVYGSSSNSTVLTATYFGNP